MSAQPRARIGRWLLTAALVATVAGEITFTWLGLTGQHVFNSEWHPHARFHVVQESLLIMAISLGQLWLLWRRRGPRTHVAVQVAFVQTVYWGGEFVAWRIPGTSPVPDLNQPNDVQLLALAIPGNLLFSGILVIVSIIGAVLIGRGRADPAPPGEKSSLEGSPA